MLARIRESVLLVDYTVVDGVVDLIVTWEQLTQWVVELLTVNKEQFCGDGMSV
jgi:hypothetical protein